MASLVTLFLVDLVYFVDLVYLVDMVYLVDWCWLGIWWQGEGMWCGGGDGGGGGGGGVANFTLNHPLITKLHIATPACVQSLFSSLKEKGNAGVQKVQLDDCN